MKQKNSTTTIQGVVGSVPAVSAFSLGLKGGAAGLVCNNVDALSVVTCSIYDIVGGVFVVVADNESVCEKIFDSCESLLEEPPNLLVLSEKTDSDVPGFLSYGGSSFDLSCYKLLDKQAGFYLLNKKTLGFRVSNKKTKNQGLDLSVGDVLDQEKTTSVLSSWLYEASDHCSGKRMFAQRGGILDIFPTSASSPIRVELNGNKIESIRIFDVETQLSKSRRDFYTIYPPAGFGSKKTMSLEKAIKETRKSLLYITQRKENLRPVKKTLDIFADSVSFSIDSGVDKGGKTQELVSSTSVFLVNPNKKHIRGSEKTISCPGVFHNSFTIPSLGVSCLVVPGLAQHKKGGASSFLSSGGYNKISSLSDVGWGDFLVHQDFGVGKYRGLQKVRSGSTEEENIKIEYAAGGSVYVPINKFDRVHKYIGGGKDPTLSKLGSTSWDKQKLLTKKSTEKDVEALINLYLARKNNRGFVYSPDSEILSALKQSFAYEETPDQQKAISDIIKDLEKRTPMDRLVYGDVGFGKTEVALRAIVSVVSSGRCVFFLAPTTVLSDQHFITCKNRLSPLGINVELLSRFRTKKQQESILGKLGDGHIDVLVGTHRLLGEDVSTKRLGMLVVDEEHRFGVSHKEYIRSLKKRVDVLTLTATPIPRTLQQSLVGIRDTSKIETPPTNRLPIKTYIKRFDWSPVASSIKNELKRGGQVYFVSNDIRGLPFYKEKILSLVPGSVVGVAHSKMGSRDLEKTILSFFSGSINVLVCTSIVESGLDVQGANTIIINNAQNFGLSQLYQIRGRVGRGGVSASCFLYVPKKHKLSKRAFQRLKSIEHYTALGSGYSIAMKDLEIRGAGNLFGFEQSGHISRVGLHLYNKFLSETIEQKKGGVQSPPRDPIFVSFSGSSFFSSDYMPLVEDRLYYYQRLSLVSSLGAAREVRGEVLDRFGKMPKAVKNLFFVAEIRSCFSFVFPKKIVFNEEGLLVELRSLPPGFEVGQVASLFANLEKSSKFKVVVGALPKDAVTLSFVGATLKDGLKVCQNLDSLFSRGRTK